MPNVTSTEWAASVKYPNNDDEGSSWSSWWSDFIHPAGRKMYPSPDSTKDETTMGILLVQTG